MKDLRTTPLPIDSTAGRVTAPARPENVWLPRHKEGKTQAVFSREVLPTKQMPSAAPREIRQVIGKRRARMVIVGYAASQPENKGKPARWVVRCDCGNYEHRSGILRWLGTLADDMCAECRDRNYRLGRRFHGDPAVRLTKENS